MTASEIKALRKMLNLTQLAFAKKLGTSRNTIARIEKGTQKVPETKKALLEELYIQATKTTTKDTVFLEKDGVRVELIELVHHFVQNKEAYLEHSEYLQLWVKDKIEDGIKNRLEDRLEELKPFIKKS